MPSETNRIPYDEMRPKVDLIIGELHELTALLTEFRNHDFGQDVNARAVVSRRVASCMVGPLIFTNPLGICDEDGSVPWDKILAASEHLIGTLLGSVRQLREMMGPSSGA